MHGTTEDAVSRPPDETLVARLMDEVAAVSGTPASDLPWLAGVVDAEALERVCRSADETLRVSFQYHGCWVAVGGDGVVDVVELDG